MIAHLSMSAAEPEAVARTLAAIWQGRALPFPPFPDSWIAFADDGEGTAIEVYPVGHTLTAGPEVIACTPGGPDQRTGPAHVAIRSPLDTAAIEAIAGAHNWLIRECDRGPFRLLELWVEGQSLIEILTPEMQVDYDRSMTPAAWAAMFGFDEKIE
ncbi:hypothetical protein [Bauldia sp.]|uniref:hypothetical protein n=1 Tax=Bauldia sp. TaxID=2575872 RepID=UPI003BAA592A